MIVAHVLRKLEASAWGGTETHVTEMAARLPAHGWQPEIHAPHATDDATPADLSAVPLRRFHAFSPFVGAERAMRDLRANGGNIASFDEILRLAFDQRIAVAHAHTCGRIGAAVRTAMRLTGRPYVVSLHGPVLSAASFLAEEVGRRLANVVDLGQPIGWALGARRVLDDAARVIAFNDDEHAGLVRRIGHRAVRMDHGVDTKRLASGDAAAAEARWPALGRDPVVLVIGRLSEQKNQVLAVRAFAAGAPRDHRLVLAGAETDAGYRAKIEREAASLGVADRVTVLGNVPRHHVPDLLARSALLLAPSKHEAFGLVALEGWAAGRPVLFARRHGLADVARALAYDAASVPTLDEADWAAALRATLAAPEENAVKGAALVARRFSWDAAAGALADLYADVVDENARLRRDGRRPRTHG